MGTVRLEDLHARAEWPEVIPTLGIELELLCLVDLKQADYVRLWRGMRRGTVFVSKTVGQKNFTLELKEGFVEKAAKRSTNLEGVAQFVLESARRDRRDFTDSAAEGVPRFGCQNLADRDLACSPR